jgi:hypothetical protein
MTVHRGAEALAICLSSNLLDALNEDICCDPFYTGKYVLHSELQWSDWRQNLRHAGKCAAMSFETEAAELP